MIEFECCRCDQKEDARDIAELLNRDEWAWHKVSEADAESLDKLSNKDGWAWSKAGDGLFCPHCWEDLHPGRIRSFMEKHDKSR